MFQRLPLPLLLLLTTTAQSQSLSIPANWEVGDQWHYELLWTIDAPELRGDNPPSTILAYPVFEVLEADKEGYTLRVHCDSARVVTGPTGQQARAAVAHYQLDYVFRTSAEGRFLEGELVFGTSGGAGQYFFEGKAEKIPADLPGVALPVFPKFEEVVRFFYQQYNGSSMPEFRLEKHPEGYRITRLFDNGLPMFPPEIIWSPDGGFRPVENFKKPEPVEPGPPRVAQAFDISRWEEEADWYIRKNDYVRRECDRLPYYGYPGYYHDVIRLWEPQYESLNNEQLHGLARAYSTAAAGLLHNNSGMADSTTMFRLDKTPNALSPEQLAQYKAAHQKAVDAYALLLSRDPAFPTPVGSVAVKYANEVVDGFLTLSYFQHEKEARLLLKPNIYSPHILQAARNTLLSCPKNAVLISQGDTDTYPLLYLQAMEKLRTDVIVANIALLQTRPYREHILRGPLGAKPLKGLTRDLFWAPEAGMSNDMEEGRPLCYSLTCPPPTYQTWQHLALEGLVYRYNQQKQELSAGLSFAVAEDLGLNLWLNTFRFDAPDAPLPPEMRPFYYTHLIAGRDLLQALHQSGRCKEALALAALLDKHFTNTMMPRDSEWLKVAETLAACGNVEDAERIGLQVWDNFVKEKVDAGREKVKWDLKRIGEQFQIETLKALK